MTRPIEGGMKSRRTKELSFLLGLLLVKSTSHCFFPKLLENLNPNLRPPLQNNKSIQQQCLNLQDNKAFPLILLYSQLKHITPPFILPIHCVRNVYKEKTSTYDQEKMFNKTPFGKKQEHKILQ